MMQLGHAERVRLKKEALNDVHLGKKYIYKMYLCYFVLFAVLVLGYTALNMWLNHKIAATQVIMLSGFPFRANPGANAAYVNYRTLKYIIRLVYGLIGTILITSISSAFYRFFTNKNKVKNPKTVLAPLIDKSYRKLYALSIKRWLYVMLWKLCFYIPGEIKKLAYSQSSYLMTGAIEHNHQISANTALSQSESLMDGHKFEFLVLKLSLLGWYALSIVTCGLFYIWFAPYKQALYIRYFNYLVADKQLRLNIEIKNVPKWYNARNYITRDVQKPIVVLDNNERSAIASRLDQDIYDKIKAKTVGDIINDIGKTEIIEPEKVVDTESKSDTPHMFNAKNQENTNDEK